jgi:hypothetical protein
VAWAADDAVRQAEACLLAAKRHALLRAELDTATIAATEVRPRGVSARQYLTDEGGFAGR